MAKLLTTAGVPRAALASVSYGKERPVCVEHTKAYRSKNRRVELRRTDERPVPPPEVLETPVKGKDEPRAP